MPRMICAWNRALVSWGLSTSVCLACPKLFSIMSFTWARIPNSSPWDMLASTLVVGSWVGGGGPPTAAAIVWAAW